MKRTITLTIATLLMAATCLKAERYYYFDHLKTVDNLPSNTIFCTHQDRSGFIWIGTRDGLCRYDGYHFLRISEITPAHKMNGTTFDITEDPSGRIWFSSSTGIGYYDPFTDEAGSIGRPGSKAIMNILADSRGNIWIASENLLRYDTSNSGMHTYSLGGEEPSMMAEDNLGNIWILNRNGHLFKYDRLNDTFTHISTDETFSIIESTQESNLLVATTDNKVLLMDCITLGYKKIFDPDGNNRVTCLEEGDKGEFWIGTDSGLFIRREHENYLGEAFHDEGTPASISADYITCMSKDKSGNMWIGTFYTGLNIWRNTADEMAVYFENPSNNSIKGKIVRSICSDNEDKIWFCTEDGWLNRLDAINQTARSFQIKEKLNMHYIVMDQKHMWICTYGDGLYLYDYNAEKVRKHYDFPDNRLCCGIKTRDGKILIGSINGLYLLDRQTDRFTIVEGSENDYIHTIYQDKREHIWLGTYGNGIICLDKNGKIVSRYKSGDGGLTSGFITSFFEDSRNRMWVTTEGGGVCVTEAEYDIENIRFSSITREDGLSTNVTCAAVEDLDGMIWVSNTNGITCISGSSLEITGHLNGGDEIKGYQYSYGAAFSGKGGVIYFGSTNGMTSIVPSKIKTSEPERELYITSIEARKSDHTITLKSEGKSVMTSSDIKIRHKDASTIYISFAAPEFSANHTLYHYTLSKGKREIISNTSEDHEVHFIGLRPGRYKFHVCLFSQEGASKSRELTIRIKPHPLLSTGACISYTLFILTILAFVFYQLSARRKEERARQYTKLVNNKEKEIYNAKINFFTNITHEIRTPLTLIKLPIDKIIASKKYTPESEKDLKTIQANTDRLLSLTNQILDMRKMERNEMKLSFIKEDLCGIVTKAVGLFEQIAMEQGIAINVRMPENPLEIMCAKDSVLTIITNLLSNAVKYGKETIDITAECPTGDNAIVRVESDGEVIPETDKEKIFQIFFQREGKAKEGQGTGLGLPYARNLANMHNGKLYLDSSVPERNSFVLELPVEQADGVKINLPTTSAKASERENMEYDHSRHTVLLVEDSEEMREYLADELSETYNIRTAVNGADALDIIRKEKVDIVVSDVMMPVMDGCELCNTIKSDSDLSHIPVILLTAVIGTDSRIESLEAGADGYIEKPFPMELLKSNIANLFKNKEISYRQFMNKPLTHYNTVTASKVDQEYMDKVHDFIMKHIAETDLNIENLTLQLGTSKSSLYRKLKANTGLSINEYIRLCRLKQAAELLSSQKYKINEVAFMTGFSSPSYFATCFQKQFDITPSEFVKNLGQ